jgi:two-component system chemotaxis response regulator CheV
MELLLFSLEGQQLFGINVFKVKEVIRTPKLTRVPHTHPAVVGITNIRGQTISIIDLQRAVGGREMPEAKTRSVIITEYNRTVQGFLVRSVDRIVNTNWKDVMPPPNQTAHESYLTAVTKVDGKLVEIIDVEKILSEVTQAEVENVENVMNEQVQSVRDFAKECHVLVIDDSVVARNQIKRTLDSMGVHVTLAKNGMEGLNTLKNWMDDPNSPFTKLALVLSDIEMPIMDGYTLTTEIRSHDRLKKLYVLLHTSLSGVFNQDMVKSVGADKFIAKFNADDLAGAVMVRIKEYAQELGRKIG